MLLVCEQVKELGVPYKLLQEVAGRTLIVDIAIQREGARAVALQVKSTALAGCICPPWRVTVSTMAVIISSLGQQQGCTAFSPKLSVRSTSYVFS